MRCGGLLLLLLGCSDVPGAKPEPMAPCLRYHFTRVLPGSGLDASVAADGTIVAVSELGGLHQASVFSTRGDAVGSFALGAFTTVVKAADGGQTLAAAADGRVRRFAPDGSVMWTATLTQRASDLVATADGGAVIAGQSQQGVLTFVDGQGRTSAESQVRAAPFVAVDPRGRLVLTSRDQCRSQAPCGAGFDPNGRPAATGTAPGGTQTSAVVVLDEQRRTLSGFVASVDGEAPIGPLFIRAGLTGAGMLVVQTKALSSTRLGTSVDIDPGLGVALRDVDTETAPDHLLGFSGRSLLWDRGFEPMDESGRAYVVGLFASERGVVVDVNGDVYGTHHILQLAPDGELRLRYDKPNDGIANDVRLAGMDDAGHIVLSGRFEGAQDFDPSDAVDTHSATSDARRYVTVISACN